MTNAISSGADGIHYLDRATLNHEYVCTNGSSLEAEPLISHRFNMTKPAERVTDTFANSDQLVTIYRYSALSGVKLPALPQPQSAMVEPASQ